MHQQYDNHDDQNNTAAKLDECFPGAIQRDLQGHGDDLGANYFVKVPAEPIFRPVNIDHRCRCGARRRMADEAILIGYFDRPSNDQHGALRGLSGRDNEVQRRSVSEVVDDDLFFRRGAIGRVSRIERRFLVAVSGESLAKVPLRGSSREGRDRVRQKMVPALAGQKRANFRECVGTHKGCFGRDQAGFLDHLGFRVFANAVPENGEHTAEPEHQHQQGHERKFCI